MADRHPIHTSLAPEIYIDQVTGSLQVKGWERPEVDVQADWNRLSLEEQDDTLRISCQGNCTIRLPHASTIQVNHVMGDAGFKLLQDSLSLGQVKGALELRNVADIQAQAISGDLSARYINGDLVIGEVTGDATLRHVRGSCRLDLVHGDVDLREIEGPLALTASGDVGLRLSQLEADSFRVQARGDIVCRLAQDASAAINLQSGEQSIRLKLPKENRTVHQTQYNLTLGEGEAQLAAQLGLSASGSIVLSAQVVDWLDPSDQEAAAAHVPDDFDQQISRQIETQIEAQIETMTRQFNEHLASLSASMGSTGLSPEQTEQILQRAHQSSERAAARAQEKMRRAQEKLERKIEANQRRSEMKSRFAGRSPGRPFSFEVNPSPPTRQPPSDPVSDEERLLILRMLEQSKITVEQAETLLSALEEDSGGEA